jgi:hypothetical protein
MASLISCDGEVSWPDCWTALNSRRVSRPRTNDMVGRQAVTIVSLLAFSPALAENLDAEAARQFIVGKLFAFTCADGSRGAARVYDDGSVIGTVQFHGSEQPRPIWLPSDLSLQARRSAVHSTAGSCALLLAKPANKVFGPPLRDSISPTATLPSACASPMRSRDQSLQSRCHLVGTVSSALPSTR